MSIVSFGREPGYPKSKISLQGKQVVVTHTDRFKVLVDDETDNGGTIYAEMGIPIGAILGGTTSRLRDVDAERSKEARLLWFVNHTYGQVDEEDSEDSNQDPEDRRPEWAWDFETLPRSVTVDADGNAIQTSAGDPIEHESLIVIPVLTIERFQLVFDPDVILEYFNRVNSSPFWGAPEGTALMAGIRDRKDSQTIWNGVAYRKVSFVIKFALPEIEDVLEGWKDLLVDHGWHKIEGGVKKPILADGHRVSRNLDGNGAVLAPGAPPHVLKFDNHEEADFDALGINNNQF